MNANPRNMPISTLVIAPGSNIRLTINTYSNPEKRETAVAGRIRIPAIPNLSAIEPADHEMDAAKANKIPTRTVLILMH